MQTPSCNLFFLPETTVEQQMYYATNINVPIVPITEPYTCILHLINFDKYKTLSVKAYILNAFCTYD